MKKRKHNSHRSAIEQQAAAELDKFDDDAAGGSFGMHQGAGSGDASAGGGEQRKGGGGGMSRAAKKRAKKRAKTAANAAATKETGAADADVAPASGNGDKKVKMQLPLDDDDDADGDNEENLLLEAQKDSDGKKKSKKKKKKKSKAKSDSDDDDTMPSSAPKSIIKATLKEASTEPHAEESENMAGVEEEMDDEEMPPELEELLATLTPLQILLLEKDEKDEEGEDSDKKPAAKEPEPSTDDNEEQDMMDADNNENEGALAGVNPLNLVADLTTEHRAKILLSSLLAPSGVLLDEFYERHWGKHPLLVCLDQDDDEDENGDNHKKKGSKQNEQGGADHEAALLKHATRLNGFLTRTSIDEMICKNKLRYGLDLNVTSYTDTMGNGLRHRITLDPPPKKRKTKKSSSKSSANNEDEDDLEYIVANPKDVWSNVDASHCSLRLLRPHEHNDQIHTMLSLLESEFGCMVGSNAYLTPLNSQGFAPHYDDVDVFILQLEGYKRWRVYAPFNKKETLPRESSRDYTEKEIEENGEELMDVVLGPGDVLYLPRGWIHQAETVPRPSHLPKLPGIKDDHSLHLTVSAMQNWCWADFLEMLMPEALEGAATSDKSTSLREGLPRNFLSYMGTMHQVMNEDSSENGADGGVSALPEGLKQVAEAQAKSGEEEELDEEALMEARARQRTIARQKHFKNEAKKRIMRVCKQAMSMLDDACDQIGKRFLSDRLPPALLPPERSLTKEALSDHGALHHHDVSKKIWPNTLCRLVRPNIARLVIEDDKAVLYHCLDNSRVFHGTPLSPMEFEVDDAPALEQLLTTVEPHWIMVKDLIHGDVEDKMEIAQALFDEGILATMLAESPDRSIQTG